MSFYPYLYYNDAKAAKDWLIKICGFEHNITMENTDGTIGHAEVKHGFGVVMFATAKPAEGKKSPMDLGGAETASVYVTVKELDSLHDRAKAAGGNITKAPYDTDYGSRDFSMKDPEGRLWFFGTYVPRHECPDKKE